MMMKWLWPLLALQVVSLGKPAHTPADVDLPRPHPVTYPPPPIGPRARAAPGERVLFWTQDSQAIGTVQQYQFALIVDKAKPIALVATCAAQPIALVFGCSALVTPKKGTHTYAIQTTCPFCAPATVQSESVTLTY